jgi:hypothetical protein
MRMHPTAVLCLLLAGVAVASAQDGKAAPQATQEKPPKARPLTPAELVAQGEEVVRHGTSVSQGVRTMLEESHKESDIIRITCLDDKLTQINVNLRSAETRLDALRKAVDPDLRVHEYTVLTVLGQKLQVLDQEAHQCVGQAMYETGATKVTTVIDTSKLPAEDNPSSFPIISPAAPVATPQEPTTAMQ